MPEDDPVQIFNTGVGSVTPFGSQRVEETYSGLPSVVIRLDQYDEGSLLTDYFKSYSQHEFRISRIDLPSIHLDGSLLDFDVPLPLLYRFEPDTSLHIVENTELNLICAESTYEECISEAESDIAVLWNDIALASDSELSEDAVKMKHYLLSLKQ